MATDSGEPLHDVQRGLALVAEGFDLLAASSGLSLSSGEVRESLAAVTALSAPCRAAYLRLLALSADRDDPSTPGTRDGAETAAWLASQARMSAGAVTAEHASIGVRALDQLPAAVLRCRREDVDALLTGHAKRFSPPITRKLARHLLDTIDPARGERFDADAHLRRQAYLGTDSIGMGILRATLEPAATAQLKAVLDQLSAPHRGPAESEDGRQATLTLLDERTPPQRRADALVEMARLASGSLGVGVRADRPAHPGHVGAAGV